MKKIFIICIMMLLYNVINAQNSITGKITDQDSITLPGAIVFIPDLKKGAVSDSSGIYELSDLPDGKLKIQFSYVGYFNQIETIEPSGENVELNIMLRQTTIEAGEIVVSGGYSSTQHGNAVKVDVLKLDQLKVKCTPNFSEILTKVPGVDMISKGSGVSKPVIRGLSMNDILILNNGVRYENYQYSDHHPLGIDEFGIENVEIIKGPASLLYGSDAIGGVANFVKEKPALLKTITGDYNIQLFSNSLGLTNNLGIKGASEKLFGGIRIGQKTNSDYLQGGGDFVPNTRFNDISLKADAGYTTKTGTFNLFYDYNDQKLGMAEDEAIDEISKKGRKNEVWYQEFNTHLLSSQNKMYLGKSRLEVNSAFQTTGLTHFGEANVREIEMQLSTLTYEAMYHLPSKDNSEYIAGFQGYNQINKNIHNRETKLLPDAFISNCSVLGLYQHTFFGKLKVQSGVRYDIKSISTRAIETLSDESYRAPLNKSYGSFSGSIGAIFNYSESLLFRANYAAAFRTPNLAELTSNGPHELRYEVGDQKLAPEKSGESDLSIHYHIDNLIIDIAGFFNRINNYIFIAPTGNTTLSGMSIYKYRQADSYLFGGEATLHFHPSQIRWLHTEINFSSVTGKQYNGDYLPFIPAHKLSFEIRGEKRKFLILNQAFVTVDTHTAFRQNNTAPEEITTNGYTLFDFSTGGNIKIYEQNISVIFSFTNVFDKKYIDHLSTLKEVGMFNPGRNITLSIKIPFKVKMIKKNSFISRNYYEFGTAGDCFMG